MVTREGKAMGFSPRAFSRFFHYISKDPKVVTPESLRDAGLGGLLDAMIIRKKEKIRVMTLVPDTPEVISVLEKNSNLQGIRFVSQRKFNHIMSKAIEKDFTRFMIRAGFAVLVLLWFLFRDMKKMACALSPVFAGLVFMFGMMGWLHLPFNLFNIIASILIIGLGVDYGIFMVMKISEGYDHGTKKAVFTSGLTTLAGFGALVLAKHPALHSIGLTVLLGIGAAIPTALLVIPSIYQNPKVKKIE
jgi:predicted RND superfamily exporter protein